MTDNEIGMVDYYFLFIPYLLFFNTLKPTYLKKESL